MSIGTVVGKWIQKGKRSPHAISVLIVLFIFCCTFFVQRRGSLQFLDFQAYDFFIRHQTPVATSDPIVLVEMTEADIHSPSLDYPIHDDKLAAVLRNLEAGEPAVIGLDIWRDIPVPKSGVGLPQFNQVLQAHSNIMAIFTLGGIAPPAILKSNYDRIAFNDNFIVDFEVDHTIPKVRRCLLFASLPTGESVDSLPYRLASFCLQRRGIEPEPEPGDPNSFRLGKARLRAFQPNDGAYVRADAAGWQMLLDFKCPDHFVRYSVSAALAGQIPPAALRDKIVLIGMNTPSVSDERVTPMSRNHHGIEVQALAVNQLLRQVLEGEKPMQFLNDWLEDIWVLLWCLAGGAIGYWVRSPWRFGPGSLAGLGALGGSTWLAFATGWWLPVAAPTLAYALATVLVTSYVSFQERAMRAVLMKLYSRHVSKEIAESIWENRDSFLDGRRPLAQKLVVTVLFTDLKGFSTLSEKMEPARLYEWLNGYLGAMAQVIQTHGGVLKQFTGDGILALFGVPVPHTTHEQQAADATAAVRCALALGWRLVEISEEWKAAGLPEVSMRAGIYTGEVAAGSVGSDDRFEYAVIGDVVNTASRLESYDKSLANPDLLPNRCRILIGSPTHELLGDRFISTEIGLLEVKGKVNKVPVFHILDEKPMLPNAELDQPSNRPPAAPSQAEGIARAETPPKGNSDFDN